ncbi:unnamed protein product (macronuclear) [Paramecium tetraurelia]|uniref:Uncharacterized protein n=1 Tax=Paramecium tetraurelia TaxID=5888 RepID=A0CK92_PARTE|nr:uncharacterized protein GSPATT00000922001 [Paramecium tetraurelia]CAK71209.1 unnamed protein product [Paramecium tetraurelia]|eukprot:XP_001438606.1 hypothetical protein (macronuclear) [Paramecium tetraurelia strain d4-2]
MQNQNKSFFDQETCLAEIELPSEWRPQFLKWTKKLEKQDKYQEKLKASLEIKNNEYFLILEDEKQSFRMNISELKQPMNKCNLLIPSPPYNDSRDVQNIGVLPYKAKAKIENDQKDARNYLNSNFSSSHEIEKSESEKEYWEYQVYDRLQLSHKDIKQPQQVMEKPPVEVQDTQTLKINLIEFLRTKGESGANIQEIKKYYKFQNFSEKNIKDTLKTFANTTTRASKLIYFLPSTLQN